MDKFDGRPLFFNSEYKDINYNEIISTGEKRRLSNKKVEKGVVFVSVNLPDSLDAAELNKYNKYLITQEAFQEFNLASDVSDIRFKLRTILYDYDDELGSEVGKERIVTRTENAASGLCLYDVIMTKHLSEIAPDSLSVSSAKVGFFDYVRLYIFSYYQAISAPMELFDRRCW